MNSSIAIWLDAMRPKTLLLAIAAIATASSIAYVQNEFSWMVFGLAGLTAMLLQVLSNLANDYGDAQQGSDTDDRIGPIRGMQLGAITQASMKKAIIFNITLIIISGLALIFYALQSPTSIITFVLLGLLSIISSITYTMGKKPYGYIGFGDISVFLFFGLLAIFGSYFLHTGYFDISLILPATGSGLLSVAVLNVNNMRDIESDAVTNKYTLVVRIGLDNAKCYHIGLLTIGWLSMVTYLFFHIQTMWLLILMLLPFVLLFKHGKIIWNIQQQTEFIPMLKDMSKIAFITNILFSIVLILGN